MRNLKKFLALVLAMMMTLSLMVTVNAASDFTDSEKINDKFSEAVQVLEGIGVFKGYEVDGKTEFRPTNNITRAEVAAIVYRLATGDAKENQAHLYEAGAAKFVDVADDHWAAGAIGYCANNLLVLGYDDSHFGPNDNVTGVQAMAMILRAVGYGKNNEFKGYGWETNVYGVARSEGLLTNVDSTSYASRLSVPATRELVAELLFQAAQIPTVTWTMLGGYNKYNTPLGMDGKENLSLGEKFFGLKSLTGIIVGNQSTGEKYTKLGVNVDNEYFLGGSYIYATDTATDMDTAGATANATLSFNFKTDLNDFGHKVKVWYDARSYDPTAPLTVGNTNTISLYDNFGTVYCVSDKSTRVDVVYATDADLTTSTAALNKAAKAAGFTVASTGAYASDAFDAITQKETAAVPQSNGDSNVFLLISNSGVKGDKTNALDLIVALDVGLATVDAKNDYSSPKNVTLANDGADITIDRTAASSFNNVLVYGEDAIKVGNWVVMNVIAGTGSEYGNTAGDPDDLYGINAITEKVEGRITSISNGTVTIDGKEYPASALWETTLTAKANRGDANLLIGNTVTLHLDKFGKYVRVTVGGEDELMGAYAYWQQEGIDGVKYYLQGVTEDGKVITKEITQDSYFAEFANKGENLIPIHHMRNTNETGGTGLGSNLQIVAPDLTNGTGYKSYSVDADGNVTADPWTDMTTLPAFINFTKDSESLTDAVTGKAAFFTDKTVFHVVTGWGSSLKVETLTGLTALLKGANSVTAQGYCFTSSDDTEQAGSLNDVIDTVILVNTKWIQPNSFLYVGNTAATAGVATKDNKAHQFQVYTVGKDTESNILVANSDYPGTTAATTTAHTFYTFTLTNEGYYQLIADAMDGENGNGYGVQQVTLDRSTSNAGTAFGSIVDDNGDRWNALNATVLDVSGANHGITDYATLRRAAERNDIVVDILLTSVGGNTASVIYVTSVTPATISP